MATPFVDFRPAQIMGDKEVYVCYYVLDPTNDKLKRMRIRCNRIKNPRERTKYATLLCGEINRKLYNGWNPLMGEDSISKKRVSIVEAATDHVRRKVKDLRKDSVRSYRSKLSFFTRWCEKVGISDWLCGRFTNAHAASLLDEYGAGGRSTYSYNSMLQFLKSLFRSFVADGLAAHNPFATFKGKKRETKRRVTIPKQDRKRILNYFHKREMSGYVAMIRLCFRYLVRPKEILMLRIHDIDFDSGLLRIPPEVSKNHTERTEFFSEKNDNVKKNVSLQQNITRHYEKHNIHNHSGCICIDKQCTGMPPHRLASCRQCYTWGIFLERCVRQRIQCHTLFGNNALRVLPHEFQQML